MSRIALLAPVSPVRSALVDHIEGLLPGLATRYDVTLVTDGSYVPEPLFAADGTPVPQISVEAFDREADTFDLVIYQLGDEPNIHGYQFDRLYERPGLVLLHDLVLHHALVERTLNRGDIHAYLAEMQHAYGDEGIEAAKKVIARQEGEAVYSAYPLCERVVTSSLATVGFNRYMCDELRRRSPGATIFETRYGYYMPDCDATSQQPQCDGAGAHLASFGIFNTQKRLTLLLDAFAALAARHPTATYHLVGARQDDPDLQDAIATRGLTGRVLPSGWLDRATFCQRMAQVDLAIQLRWPHVGGTPYTPIRLLGNGVPTIISDIKPLAELPNDGVVRITPNTPQELAQVIAAVDYLLSHPAVATAMAKRGQAHVVERHDQQVVLDRLCTIIDQVIDAKESLVANTNSHVAVPPRLQDYSALLIPVAAAALSELGLPSDDPAYARPAAVAIAGLTREV